MEKYLSFFKKIDWLHISALLTLSIAFVFTRLYALHSITVWYDEAVSLIFAKLPIKEIITQSVYEQNTPFYYFFLRLWYLVFGGNVLVLRLSSLLIALLNVIVLYLLTLKLSNKWGALLSFALVYVSPLQTTLAVELRVYGLIMLLSLINLYSLWMLLTPDIHKSKKWAVLYVLSAILGLLFHLTFIVYLFAQTLFYFVYLVSVLRTMPVEDTVEKKRGHSHLLIILVPWVIMVLLIVFFNFADFPLYTSQISQIIKNNLDTQTNVDLIPIDPLLKIIGLFLIYHQVTIAFILSFCVIYGLNQLYMRQQVFAGILIINTLITAIVLGGIAKGGSRYVVFIFPIIAIFFSIGFVQLSKYVKEMYLSSEHKVYKIYWRLIAALCLFSIVLLPAKFIFMPFNSGVCFPEIYQVIQQEDLSNAVVLGNSAHFEDVADYYQFSNIIDVKGVDLINDPYGTGLDLPQRIKTNWNLSATQETLPNLQNYIKDYEYVYYVDFADLLDPYEAIPTWLTNNASLVHKFSLSCLKDSYVVKPLYLFKNDLTNKPIFNEY